MQLRSILVCAVAYSICIGNFSLCPALAADDTAAGTLSTGLVDGVFVGSDPSAKFVRRASNMIALAQGAVVVSVDAPAAAALIVTRLGRIKIKAGTSALIGITGDVLKVQSLKGGSEGVIVGLRKDFFGTAADDVVKLNAGQEITAVKPQNVPAAPAGTQPNTTPPAAAPTTAASAPAPGASTQPAVAASGEKKSGIAPVLVGAAFGGAGVVASAALISCIDKGIRKDEDRRVYRNMLEQSAFMDAWQHYNKPNILNNNTNNNNTKPEKKPEPKPVPPKPESEDEKASRQAAEEDRKEAAADQKDSETQAKSSKDDSKEFLDSLKDLDKGGATPAATNATKRPTGDKPGAGKPSNTASGDSSKSADKTPSAGPPSNQPSGGKSDVADKNDKDFDLDDDKKNATAGGKDSSKNADDLLGLDDKKDTASTGKSGTGTGKPADKDDFDLDDKKDTASAGKVGKPADKDDLDLDDKKDAAAGKGADKDLGLDDKALGDAGKAGTTGGDPFAGLFGGNAEVEKAASAVGTGGGDNAGWFGELADKAGAGADAGAGALDAGDLLKGADVAGAEEALKGADSAVEMPDIPIPDAGDAGAIMDAIPSP